MATPRMDITSFVGKLLEEDDVDLLREGVRVLAQALMETEVSSQIGAAPYERSSGRTAYRNGYRTRTWDTRVGTIELKISKVTAGTYFPSLLEPRRRAEKALHAVVCEAYVKGISTRKVDDLVRALGMDGISRSEVSRICKALDEDVKTFLHRGIEDSYPYLWIDATFHKIREGGRVVSVATVVAVGVSEAGHRSVLGVDTGPSEDHSFWVAFLRSLVRRGLKGVRLVTSDAHEGLRQAVAKVLSGTQWQRCRVHFMRNLLSVVPKAAQETVAAIVRTVFSQPDHGSAMAQLKDVAEMLQPRFPQAADLLEDAAEDLLAHLHFPREHRRRLHSTNPLERLHKEIKRRTNVVGIFPNRASLVRMVATLLSEQDDEWQVAERRYFSAGSMAHIDELGGGDTPRELLAAIA
ncbi:MAG TPA: IS256 family transposase [Actinomycetota bacterium]|nr:IS256 family transposase [Actinomycetota bacterium]